MTVDILRKATTADYIETIDNLRAEVERLRYELTTANVQIMAAGEIACAKDARLDLLDSDQKRYHAAWMAAEEDKEEQAARIKELQDLIDKPPEEADWVADYHLSTYQNASGNA